MTNHGKHAMDDMALQGLVADVVSRRIVQEARLIAKLPTEARREVVVEELYNLAESGAITETEREELTGILGSDATASAPTDTGGGIGPLTTAGVLRSAIANPLDGLLH